MPVRVAARSARRPEPQWQPSHLAASVPLGSIAEARGLNREREGFRQVVLGCNADGVDALRRGEKYKALEQLKYAEAVLVADECPDDADALRGKSSLLALTCSNLGCYYRKAGLPRAALQYLDRALQVEEATSNDRPEQAKALATTMLNTCAALSSVGRHGEAEDSPRTLASLAREECALVAVACHNLGTEREHLGVWSRAAVAYKQGADVARKVLGPRDVLTATLAERCRASLKKAEKASQTPRKRFDMSSPWRSQAAPRTRADQIRRAAEQSTRAGRGSADPASQTSGCRIWSTTSSENVKDRDDGFVANVDGEAFNDNGLAQMYERQAAEVAESQPEVTCEPQDYTREVTG